jgi:hypothetical protein
MKLIYRGTTYDYNRNRKKIDRTLHCGNCDRIDSTISNLTRTVKPSYEVIDHGNVYQVTRSGCDRYLTLR